MIPLIYILINLIHALYHSVLIKKGHLIQSKQKVIEYCLLSLLAGAALKLFLVDNWLPLILFPVLTRLAFFDPFLNLFRGKPFEYEGSISKKKSLWDWIESKLGIPIFVLRIFYLAAFVIYLIIYLT